jgi:predicted TPR repeat methyltransferase
MSTDFLSRVYRANSPDQVRSLYDDWAASYEAEIAENGYVTPARCAEALLQAGADRQSPVLDFGCGTGLSGLALKLAGFEVIDGRDLSEGMIAKARDKGVYRDLAPIGPDDPVPTGYAAIAAIGVVSPGAAPLPVLDRLIGALKPGGRIVFSFNDHALEHAEYRSKVDDLTAVGGVRELFREYGEHLPGINLKSTVYVLEKT